MQRAEFKRAFLKTQAKYPRIHLGMAWKFILDFEAALRANTEKVHADRQPFGHLIRLTLNEIPVSEKSERTMYAALVGYLFGARGVHKKAHMRARRIPTVRGKKQSAPTYEVVASEKGQLEWKL